MASTEDVINPYELLEVAVDSNDADIRKAYRQRSLKVHPDRVCLIINIEEGFPSDKNPIIEPE